MVKKILIVGGVAGGASAAARLRRLDETSTIILFERGEHISFANCGLPYYIGETIKSRKKLFVQTPESMGKRFNLDIRPFNEVIKIDRVNKTVVVRNVRTNEEYKESYDTLILSPGAKPLVPQIPGLENAKNIFTLRNIPDTDRVKQFVDEMIPSNATVIGGGFIGLEMAENLAKRGVKVTLIEMANQVMAPLDYEMAAIVHQHLVDKGVQLILSDGVKSFENEGKTITLSSGKRIDTDLNILSIGVQPENNLAMEANLKLGARGGIIVNDFLQTGDEHIYAIGDAIEVVDYTSGTPAMIPLAGPANRQGRIVANNISGKKERYKGTLGTSIAKVFDLTVATTGINEKQLKQLGKSYEVVHIHPLSHAGYYPGATPLSLKLLFHKESGEIYGAQAVGINGVDKRIDVIATAIKGKLTVYDLTELELAYAPPFSSAKDPVNMAGYVAVNMIEGIETVQWYDIDKIVEDGNTLIDVRDPIEREAGYIKGSINIPLNELRDRLKELPIQQTLYVTCQVGLRGYLAVRILKEQGFLAINLDGGWKTYSTAHEKFKNIPTEQQEGTMGNPTKKINATGLTCPGPLMEVHQNIKQLNEGEILEITTTDMNFSKDISAWCQKTNNTLLTTIQEENGYRTFIQKGIKIISPVK
ncbi:CoA-disulfide reductase [Bacillus timonensis]|nr:CoA-disulfide reductase [Bacillus timonensis]